MGEILIVVLITFLVIYLLFIDIHKTSGLNRGDSLILSIIVGLIICSVFVVLTIFATIINTSNVAGFTETRCQKLVSFNDKFFVAGSFFLGTGEIDQGGYYVYYVQSNTTGEIRLHKISSDSASIIEEDRKDAVLKRTYHVCKPVFSWWLINPGENELIKTQFIVPRGTVKRSITANLGNPN